MRKIISALVLASLLAIPVIGLAQAGPEEVPPVDFWEALDNITTYLFGILIIIAVMFLIIAGIYFATAQGDAEKVKKARDMVLYALVGVIVGVLAKGLVTFVRNMVEG